MTLSKHVSIKEVLPPLTVLAWLQFINETIKSLQTGFGPDVLSLAQLVEFPTEKKKG